MATFNGRAIPPELVDYMLDEITSQLATIADRQALKHCSLVCKTWLPRSSVHLLRTIEVRSLQLQQYLTFAKTSARLRAHVREFIIQGTIDVTLYLSEIFVTMPGLVYLEQWNNLTSEYARPPDMVPEGGGGDAATFRYYVDPPAGFTAARSASLSIVHLHLSSMPLTPVALSIRPFKQIGTLELRSISRKSYHQRGPHYHGLLPFRPAPEVKTLIFDGGLAEDLCSLLLHLPLWPTTVVVKGFASGSGPALSDFLVSCGRNAEKLVLWPRGDFRRPNERQTCESHPCYSLILKINVLLSILPASSESTSSGTDLPKSSYFGDRCS